VDVGLSTDVEDDPPSPPSSTPLGRARAAQSARLPARTADRMPDTSISGADATSPSVRPHSMGTQAKWLQQMVIDATTPDFRRSSPDRGPRLVSSAARARARATSHDEVPMADGTGDGDEQDSWSPVQRLHRLSRYSRHRRASKEGAEGEPPLGSPPSLPSREGEGRKMEGQDKLV